MGNTFNTNQKVQSKDNTQTQTDKNAASTSLLSDSSTNVTTQPNSQYGTLFETTWKTEPVFGGTKHAYSHDVFLTGYQINKN